MIWRHARKWAEIAKRHLSPRGRQSPFTSASSNFGPTTPKHTLRSARRCSPSHGSCTAQGMPRTQSRCTSARCIIRRSRMLRRPVSGITERMLRFALRTWAWLGTQRGRVLKKSSMYIGGPWKSVKDWRENPGVPGLLRAAYQVHFRLANSLRQMGRREEAAESDRQLQAFIEGIREKTSGDWYDLACAGPLLRMGWGGQEGPQRGRKTSARRTPGTGGASASGGRQPRLRQPATRNH